MRENRMRFSSTGTFEKIKKFKFLNNFNNVSV